MRKYIGVFAAIAGCTLALTSPASAATNFFRINQFDSKLPLTAESASEGARVVLSGINQFNFRQQWSIKTNAGTAALTYVLRQKISSNGQLVDGCLDLPRDVNRDQQQPGEVLVVRKCDGSNSQKWLDVNTNSSTGTVNLENSLSLMKLDVVNNVAVQKFVSSPSQRVFKVFVTSA
ncbi:hypothetical protein Lesp02_08460 [Lentzea sp. NBRC 105346]|uniref:hypothetical protein n=1 Tax=Lentzea sp. NBRC 105346 TaxID=3032205 RepID=UPI0024A2F6B2|nr:hypothetical protein [Lentzea sp. NBRC 105346]GLZ28656.1 hypothetical protein Lesp02_08460 [Lentzea sp. NBRC 105346]